MSNIDIIVIGGGPAGMMAAITAGEQGKKVLLIEKNKFMGRKLRITGKGRCNVTNACEAEDFFRNIVRNPKFMYSAFYTFDNNSVISFFEESGTPLKTERGNRVFPVSDKAGDIVDCLNKRLRRANVEIIRDCVKDIIINDGKVVGVKLTNEEKYASKVIVATGGISYPVTGSTGDGYKFALRSGHRIVEPRGSLVPVECEGKLCRELQGLSLRNVSLSLKKGEKEIYSDFGEMLFSHFGITGPVVLSASAHIKDNEKYTVVLDLKPALSENELDKRILKDFDKNINKDFVNSLSELLPVKLINPVIELSGIDPRKKVNSVTKEERMNLTKIIKNLTFKVKGLRPVDEAVVTSGGVSVKDINPSDMQSKIVEGLYFCGEVIDVDAYTGGFNLQIAFSTGYLAGLSAAEN
ncbi:MAG: NAD(P)/FAD-dependent oxidoreductase [Clostridia bacterium]|nr:NAD(P)/FAD-dependent oxidoreductase [Clostridia bacterium]